MRSSGSSTNHGRRLASARRRATLFSPGRNCHTVARAERAALLVDGDEYFGAFARAALRAEHSILIVGWDFHSQTRLHLDAQSGAPPLLGDFLNFLAARRRTLHVHLLIWDYPVIYAAGRELAPIYGVGWKPHRRVHVCFDDRLPLGAAHHQKIVVVDGAMAFCGGLDLTRSRWDTPEHLARDPRRTNPHGAEPYGPVHDTVMAVDGAAARALEEIARARWHDATGRTVPAARDGADAWPPDLPVGFRDADVAVSRSAGSLPGRPAVQEIEALHLDLINAARRCIYIENQYFTSHLLGEALAARLAEPDGPEVVAILRLSTSGWLEGPTMGLLRTALLERLRAADRHGRFHAYYPQVPDLPADQHYDLHSKLMIADDEWLSLGSANFCNRSLRLDTECNLALEAGGDAGISAAIRGFRERLLAEHLGVSPEATAAATRCAGSVHGAIEALRGDGRTLCPFQHGGRPSDIAIGVARVADPEQPVSLQNLVAEFAPDTDGGARPKWTMLLLAAVALAALAASWRYTPLSDWAEPARMTAHVAAFAAEPWAPLVIVLAYTPAALILFPRPLITLSAVFAFGPWRGFSYAFTGIMLAAVATYALGRRLDRAAVRRLAGERLNRLTSVLCRRGLVAMTAVRLVPLAPFAVVNIVAGAIRLRLLHFVAGSAIGILPGTLAATVFGDQVLVALRDPRALNHWLIAGAALLAVVGAWAARRWLLRGQSPARAGGD